MQKINWTIKEVEYNDLKGYANNPRDITPQSLKLLEDSLQTYGQVIPLVVNQDMTVLGGNQRLKVIKGNRVLVSIPDRMLTDKEQAELVITLNNKIGEWDFSKLEALGFTKDILIDDFGFDEEYIEANQFKLDDLDAFFDETMLSDGFTEVQVGDTTVKQLIIKFTEVNKTPNEIMDLIREQKLAEGVESMEDLVLNKARKYETHNS